MDRGDPGRGAAGAEDRAPLARRWPLAGTVLIALASFVIAAAVSVVLAIALGVALRDPLARGPEDILVLTLSQNAVLLVVLFGLAGRFMGVGAREMGLLARPSGAHIRFALLASGALWTTSIAINAVQVAIFGPAPQDLVITVGAHAGLAALAMDLATASLVAPLGEEILYRGFLFGGLVTRLGFAPAAAISGVLWAASHGLGVLLPISVLGIGLAYVYWRTQTLWAPILAHAVINAVSLALVFALPKP